MRRYLHGVTLSMHDESFCKIRVAKEDNVCAMKRTRQKLVLGELVSVTGDDISFCHVAILVIDVKLFFIMRV